MHSKCVCKHECKTCLELDVMSPLGSTEEEDKRLGFVAPVLFFILALQTGLSGLDPEERLV